MGFLMLFFFFNVCTHLSGICKVLQKFHPVRRTYCEFVINISLESIFMKYFVIRKKKPVSKNDFQFEKIYNTFIYNEILTVLVY